MKKIGAWTFIKKNIPMAERYKQKNNLKILHLVPMNVKNPEKLRKKEAVLVCGDGDSLPDDVKRFESMGVEHDVYCVNRSMLYFERPIDHWAAIDAEESMWFSSNLTEKVVPRGMLYRHTIGACPMGYDVFWKVDQKFENETQKHLWSGNSGYFGILSAIAMGYKKIIVAGMPLNTNPHWYEDKSKPGPNWVGNTYRMWMDFKHEHPKSDRVRSMSGYSGYILGKVNQEWLQNTD